MGGRPVAYLCKWCNSYLGATFEAAAVDLIERGPGPPSIVRAGHPAGPKPYARATWGVAADGSPSLVLEPAGSGADAAYATSHGPDHRLTVSFREHSPHVVKLAYLAWAYLCLFAEFGYAFVLSPSTRITRLALVSGSDSRMGRAYWIRWGDLTMGTPQSVVLLGRGDSTSGANWSFLSLGVRIGTVAVIVPPASDVDGETYLRADELMDDRSETDRMLPVPFWQWYGLSPRDFLDAGCHLWRRTAGGLMPVVHSTPDLAAAALHEAQVPAFRPRQRRRAVATTPAVAPLPTTLGPTTWLGFAAQVLASWWGRQPASKTRSLVLPGDGSSLIRVAAQIAPHYLVEHLRDIERIFGPAVAEDEDPRSSMTAMDVLLDWGKANSVSIGEVTITDEMIDTERNVGQTWMWCRLDGQPMLIGPFYTERTFLAAVRPCLDEWLAGARREGQA